MPGGAAGRSPGTIELTSFHEDYLDAAAGLFAEAFAAEPWNEVWPAASARRRLADLVFSPGFLGAAARRGDKLVGFALGRVEAYRDEEHYCLQEMCVSPEYRGQGIGTMLVRHLEERLKERGCRQVYLLTLRDSGPESFYLRCGFSPARRVGVMVKRLE